MPADTVVNCQTGEVTSREMTGAELTAYEALRAVPTMDPTRPPPEDRVATLAEALISKGVLTKDDLPADLAVAVDAIAIDKP